MANFGDIPSNVVLAAGQSIRRNAANDAFEAYTPGGGGSAYTFQHSLVEAAGVVNLVNDSASPGNSKYYGTNGSGTRGFYDLPIVPTFSNGLTLASGNVKLGGTLQNTTDIDLDDKTLWIYSSGSLYNIYGPDDWWISCGDVNPGNTQYDINLSDTYLELGRYTDSTMIIYSLTANGLVENADYSSIYGDRTLVARGWVNAQLANYEPTITGGTTSQYWRGDKTWQTFPTIPTIGGSDTHVQYNNSGSFGGSSDFTWNNTTKALTVGNLSITNPWDYPEFRPVGTDAHMGMEFYSKGTFGWLWFESPSISLKSSDTIYLNATNLIDFQTLNFSGTFGTHLNLNVTNSGSLWIMGGEAALYSEADVKLGPKSGSSVYIERSGVGALPAKSTETNVVYYDTATGKLSYGTVSTGTSVSFGLENQIPYTNSTTDDFNYSSKFSWNNTTGVLIVDNIIRAPNSTGTGVAGKDLIIRAGDAWTGEENYGRLYLSSGIPQVSNNIMFIHFGVTNSPTATILLEAESQNVHCDIHLRSKGLGATHLGKADSETRISGSETKLITDLIRLGFDTTDSIIFSGVIGTSITLNGKSIVFKGGDAYATGNNNGGSLYLYGGAPNGTGSRGNVYFGDGTTGYLSGSGTGTSVVLYNRTTGQLTYGDMSTGSSYTFQHSLTETTGVVNLVGDSASPGTHKFYGTDSGGTRGWRNFRFIELEDTPSAYSANSIICVDSLGNGLTMESTIVGLMHISTDQAITGAKTFANNKLLIRNPADTFSYIIAASAITTANRTITLPLLTGNDTLVTADFTQTLTNKTINAANNTLTGVARTDAANIYGDFTQTFKDNSIRINNPADTFYYTITAAAIAGNYSLNLPLTTGTDTLATLGLAQTWTGKQLFYFQVQNTTPITGSLTITNANYTSWSGRINFVAAGVTITINYDVPTDFHATFIRTGTGEVAFAGGTTGGTVTIYSSGSKKRIDVQYEAVHVYKTAAGTVYLLGSLKT